MTFPRARLAVAATLFLAWLGYLLHLVVASQHTIVLSRPQFLVASLCVLAEVTDDGNGAPKPEVEVVEILWAVSPADGKLKGTTIHVANLPEAAPQGYIGPGKYILPLDKEPFFRITRIPPSPGFVPAFVNVQVYSCPPDGVDRAADLAHEHLGLDKQEARALLKELDDPTAKGLAVALARNVPRDRAVAFLNEFLKNAGAEAIIPGNDIRIYPLTPETQEQLDEMLKARQAQGR